LPVQPPRPRPLRRVALSATHQRVPRPASTIQPPRRHRRRRGRPLASIRRSRRGARRPRPARAWVPPARRGTASGRDPAFLSGLLRAGGGGDRGHSTRNGQVTDPPGDDRPAGRARCRCPAGRGRRRESGMSERTTSPIDFERSLVDWLEAMAPDREPADLLGRVLETTLVTRRRPGWWKPGGPAASLWQPRQMIGRTLAVAAVLLLLILALAVALAVGSRPQEPLPLGRPGLIVAGRLGELLLVDESGAVQRRVPTGEFWGYGAWSRDGTRLAYADGAATDPFLVVTNPELDEVARIRVPAGTVAAFSWSPDGRQIAFGVVTETDGQIYVVDAAAGKVPVPITDSSIDARAPSWSPDGSLIAFRAGVSINTQALFVMQRDGTGITRLSQQARAVVETCGFPWTPDGRSILFETRFAGVWAVDGDGTNERE